MKHAETVTFGGSDFNRAADQRDPEAQNVLWERSDARITYLWRGKPAFVAVTGGSRAILWTSCDHLATGIEGERIFLGLDDDGSPLFAQDISAWVPDLMPDTQNQFLDESEQVHPQLPAQSHFAELRAVMTELSVRDAELTATARGLIEWHRTHQHCANCGAVTDAVMGGWQRSCAACGRQHFPRTDPVVIMLITNGNAVLMGRSPGWPEGMYSLLAGFVEPGETIEAAVRREVWEEAGIRVGEVGYLASQPWPFPASLMMGCWGHATSCDITIDPNEIEDAQWVTREQMMDVFEGVHPIIRPARPGAIAHFLIKNWLSDRLN